ncbi:MAG: phage GP46 family protein [Nitrosopumilus sp.]
MNIDIALDQTKGYFDVVFTDREIKPTEGFDTAMWVSLFSDQRATASEQPDPLKRRGWIGDIDAIDEIGSKLWFLDQARIVTSSLNKAIDFAQKSLNWMIEDSLAKKIDITGELRPDTIILFVVVTTPDGAITNFSVDIWRKTLDQLS